MNYFEELRLSRSATTEEIRQAFKNLARLLHPDQHQDERLKLLAECQMKRLNEIVAILTDPDKRREYEASLDAVGGGFANKPTVPIVVVTSPAELRERSGVSATMSRNWVWVAVAGIGLASVLWYLSKEEGRAALARSRPHLLTAQGPGPGAGLRHEPDATVVTPSESRQPRHKPQDKQLLELQHQLKNALSERDGALAELAQLRSREAGRSPIAASPPMKEHVQELPPDVRPSGAAAGPDQQPLTTGRALVPQKEPVLEHSPFAGNWFYSDPSRDPTSESLYPAEYIELVIREEAGLLGGRYRARYRVADRAISPEVVFQFEGRASTNSAQGHWSAGGGARGEVQLKLLSQDSMEVNWWATVLGKGMGLASGTAVLIRRQEP